LLIGCGGGGSGAFGGSKTNGSGGGAPVFTGNKAVEAVAISTAKSVDVAEVGPFAVLRMMAPTGSGLTQAPGSLVKRVGSRLIPSSTLTSVPFLGLYEKGSVANNVLTVSFYSDAAGKTYAGKMVINSTANVTSTAYTSYPVTIRTDLDITGGKIPVTGSFFLVFQGQNQNALAGGLTLTAPGSNSPLNTIGVGFNVSVDPKLNVSSDSIFTVQQNGLNATMTNLSGRVVDNIIGDVSVDPLGLRGKGSLNLEAATFTITFADASGSTSASTDSSNKLTVSFPSGASDIVEDPAAFLISGLQTTGTSSGTNGTTTATTGSTTGTTGTNSGTTGSTGFQTPTVISNASGGITQALSDGELVGNQDNGGYFVGQYWSSPTAQPIVLPPPSGYVYTEAHGIVKTSTQTVVVGSYYEAAGNVGDTYHHPCVWTAGLHLTSFGAPTLLSLGSLGKNGDALAISPDGREIVGFFNDTTLKENPVMWLNGTPLALPTDGRSTNLDAIGIDSHFDIIGQGEYPNTMPVVWQKVVVSSGQINVLPRALTFPNGSTFQNVFRISPTGVAVGGSTLGPLYWSMNNAFKMTVLKTPSGTGKNGGAYAISDDGTKAAGTFQIGSSYNSDLGYWPTLSSTATDVTKTYSSPAYSDMLGLFILGDGSLIAMGQDASSNLDYLYLKSK
jgi:hypothetical protein